MSYRLLPVVSIKFSIKANLRRFCAALGQWGILLAADSSSVISPARWRQSLGTDVNKNLTTAVISLYGQAVGLRFPDKLESEIRFMFPGATSSAISPQTSIAVEELDEDRFRVSSDLKGTFDRTQPRGASCLAR